MNNNLNMMTPYDEAIQNPHLQMLKAMIPYVDKSFRMNLVMFIQYYEMQSSFQTFNKPDSALSICEIDDKSAKNTQMLKAIRKYCTPKEQETIDTLLNVFCILENYDSSGHTEV